LAIPILFHTALLAIFGDTVLNIASATWNNFPLIDAFLIIYFVKPYRHAFLHFFCGKKNKVGQNTGRNIMIAARSIH
jgi:hypothetical protein